MTALELDKILAETIETACSIGIPVSKRIIPHVYINKRRKTILGTCEKQKNGEYKIVVSAFVLDGGEAAVRNVIAHEVLHTCKNCANHGDIWKGYAKRLGKAIGQEIKRTGESETAEDMRKNAPYVLICKKCGREFYRMKRSSLVKYPEKYRCTCGGKIVPKVQA